MAQAQTPATRLEDYDQWKLALTSGAVADPATIVAPPGFEVELVRVARPEEGSWIDLAFDPRGRIVVAREERGLLRMTLSTDRSQVERVETIDHTLLECRGLLFVANDLYAAANDSRGIYRLRDTDGDDRFDEVKLLKQLDGGLGHGRNSLALGPDKKLYVACGNNVKVPADVDPASPYRNYGLDRLLPCHWNEFLFDAGAKPPCGFILRTDLDGKQWELFAGGFRNPYGLAFNALGDLFTYDADMEWDVGAPWYRPTRIVHVISGGEYGWRQGTSVWPDYFADMLPGVVDIGLGSPTGVIFGTKSHFPEPYRNALFALDWAYGRILAVHLAPQGATYKGRVEPFIQGKPLNVTGADIGPDGAMYFTVGGRKTQGAIYRVRAISPDSDVGRPRPASTSKHELLQQLCTVQTAARQSDLELLLQSSRDGDRWIRVTARVGLEHLYSSLPDPSLMVFLPDALSVAEIDIARARSLPAAPKQEFVNSSFKRLRNDEQATRLVALRGLQLTVIRQGAPPSETWDTLCHVLDALYPAASEAENQLLSELLVYLKSPNVVAKTMKLLDAAKTQEEQLFYIFTLRNVDWGWTIEDRRRYFEWLKKVETFRGAHYMARYATFIRTDALATLTADERVKLAPQIDQLGRPAKLPDTPQRPFVHAWKIEELRPALAELNRGRNFERGRAMFTAALCIQCHRFGDEGVAVGPDLANIAARFSRRDILETILLPSKIVEEKYRTLVFLTDDGRVVAGQIAGGDAQSLVIATDPLAPTHLVHLARSSIESRTTSKTSIMPEGLLNSLSRDEVLDLLAFLESGGNPQHADFRP